MLKFFRRIRQQLLIQNRISKYLLYAIGEIILVVFGILIALQVNNRNEERKLKKLEIEYVQALQRECKANLTTLNKAIDRNSLNLKNGKKLLSYLGPDINEISDKRVSRLLGGTIYTEAQFRPSIGVLNEIISSGKLGLLSNASLREKLSSWEGLMIKIRFQENEHYRYRLKLFDLLEEEGNFRKTLVDFFSEDKIGFPTTKFSTTNLKLLQSEQMENYLVGFVITAELLNTNYYYQAQDHIEEVLEMLAESKSL